MSEQGHLRIGTDDRRKAVARLQSAAAEGRLTAAEASGRMAAVEAALTYADLHALLGDLPSIAPPAATGWDAAHPLPIASGMSREKRIGRWEIPPYLRLSGDFGSVRLDCREAVCLAPRFSRGGQAAGAHSPAPAPATAAARTRQRTDPGVRLDRTALRNAQRRRPALTNPGQLDGRRS